MTAMIKNEEDVKRPYERIFAETLERARRRCDGEVLPITSDDEHWTRVMISVVTYYLDRSTRLSLLTSVIGNALAGMRPTKVRERALDDVLRLLRKHVNGAVKAGEYRNRPKKIEVNVERRLNEGCGMFDPYDVFLADETFDRAVRRGAGENLEVTDEDLRGTIALIQQLMTDIDYDLLIDMTANAIVEEYDGLPPNGVFWEFKRLVRRTISGGDLMNGSFGGTIH